MLTSDSSSNTFRPHHTQVSTQLSNIPEIGESNHKATVTRNNDDSNKPNIVISNDSFEFEDGEFLPSQNVTISNSDSILPPRHPSSTSSSKQTSDNTNHKPGWSSGASTPRQDSMDLSIHSQHNSSRSLMHSSSILGLDKMIEAKAEKGLTNNIVHMEVPFGKPIEEVYEGIHDGSVLGSGISGLVRLCTHKVTGVQYAVKCLDLGLVDTDEGLQQLREEIAIMCQLDHPNIVRLEEVYESHSEIYLVQELCVGGELFDRLDEQPDYHYSEAQCARLVKQMLCSVRYIHSKGIIHRDLKLENFLFSNVNPDSELKMIDFGLSKHFQYGEVHHEAVGTPYTVAPEVIRGEYDERCDVWGIGVITYLLLSGDPPFGGCGGPESLFQVRSNILQGKFKFEPAEVWAHVSQEAKDYIRMLLVTDPNNRPTAKECQRSPWLHEWANKDKVDTDTSLSPNVVKALVNFKEYSDMRKLLCEVLSFTLLPDQIADLRKEFEKLDTEGSGEISLKGLKKVLMQEAEAGSLGALGEDEVEDIFNAMRVGNSDTQIHWHEFIAAGLSQCKVDERNLKLAFDRLDSNHKGYITFDNIMDLMGRDGADSEDKMKDMWSESMQDCNCNNARITYDDFLLLMKGQTRSSNASSFTSSKGFQSSTNTSTDTSFLPSFTSGSLYPSSSSFQPIALDVLHEMSESVDDEETPVAERRLSSQSRRNSAGIGENDIDMDDLPPSIDEEDDFDQKLSDIADKAMSLKQDGTTSPPRSPCLRPAPITDFTRRRSRSVDDQDLEGEEDASIPLNVVHSDDHFPGFHTDIRRALPLPEHTHDRKEIEKVIHNENLTPLVVNRKLYREHRKMRHAVLEATKRFDDQQMKRTKAEIQAQQQAESTSRYGAGLVMRRGHKKEVSTGTIRKLMIQKQKQHESNLKLATRKSGRETRSARRGRKKTVSDMSAMMSATITEEPAPAETENDIGKEDLFSQSLKTFDTPEADLPLHDVTKPEPTIPGVFRKTIDPFQTMGQQMMGLFGRSMPQSEHIVQKSTLEKKSSNIKISVSDGDLNTLEMPDSPTIQDSEAEMSQRSSPPPLPL